MISKGKTNIKEWLSKCVKLGIINDNSFQRLVESNENKEGFLNKYSLPRYKQFGKVQQFRELERLVPDEHKINGKFWVRNIPKNDDLPTTSKFNVSYNHLEDIIKKSGDNYIFQIIEYFKGEYSGTIIINQGKLLHEMWEGDHKDSEKKKSTKIFVQSVNTPFGGIHFDYSKNTKDYEKNLMVEGIKFFSPNLTMASLENLRLYADYIYTKNSGYIFIDGSELDFWTKI